MRTSRWFTYPMALLASVALLGRATPVVGADGGGVPAERLDRLEQRVNEIAQRQEQLMHRLEGQKEFEARMAPPERVNLRPEMAPVSPPPPPTQLPPVAKLAKSLDGLLGLGFIVWILCNILLAIWIFTDIRKRGEGPGLFIVLALVAGIPAAIIYSLVRIGDRKA